MNKGRYVSPASQQTWQAVRWLLTRGHRVLDILKVYGEYGITESAVYTKNSREWHIRLKQGVSRGVRCIDCKLKKPNYRSGICQSCYNISRRKGRAIGPNHWNWQGGKTKTAEYVRFSPEYRAWRKAVFERDNYTCQLCNVRGAKLNADHIKPQSIYPELRLDLNNGRTLCVDCHRKTPTYGYGAIKLKKLVCADFFAGS